uniref:RING-type domain-containing protein n=1 Tax=Aegilops tauschii subsp. strangulata TaxID=200361 RepID=A0A453LPY4_AEGTS
ELGAFHLNCDSSDIDEPVGFFKNGFFKNFSCDLTGTQPVMTMAISETIKYDYSLTCPICLDTLFNPYALSCGHLFCKGCACGAASVYIFQGVRSAPPEAKCPVCREVGVFAHAVHMNELDLLIKTRVQRLLEMQATRGADRDGEAIQRILGVPGHAVDGYLNHPGIAILCLHW